MWYLVSRANTLNDRTYAICGTYKNRYLGTDLKQATKQANQIAQENVGGAMLEMSISKYSEIVDKTFIPHGEKI